MSCVITHLDTDGIISLALILRVRRVERVYFSSPSQIKDTICYSILGHKHLDEIIISDITGNRESIILSSVYEKALWLDHHDWSSITTKIPENVTVIVRPEKKSAARVVAEHFELNSVLVDIADEVDTNNIRSEEARTIRNIVGGLRMTFHGSQLKEELLNLAVELNKEDFNSLKEKYRNIEERYKKYTEEIAREIREKTKEYVVNNLKIGIYETTESIPVYIAASELEYRRFDILIVMLYGISKNGKPYTKMEFRTHTNTDVLKIAKFFGGGGHLLASGATVPQIITVLDVLNAISTLYS